VAGGAGIPNIGDCAGGAGPTPCFDGLANRRVYSLGPSCTGAGGGAGGGVDGEPGCAAGELNSLVYSPPPNEAAGGVGAGGMPGLALENAVVAPPGRTGAGATGGIGDAFAGPEGVPNKRVKAPGSCCAGGGAGGGVATGGRLSSSPPGRDSGIGDWKNFVNSPEFAGSDGGSALTGGLGGDRNILVNAPGSEDEAAGPASDGAGGAGVWGGAAGLAEGAGD